MTVLKNLAVPISDISPMTFRFPKKNRKNTSFSEKNEKAQKITKNNEK